MQENRPMTIALLKQLSNLDVIDFEFEELKNMENVAEYKFSMIKLKAKLDTKENIDVYIRLIKKDKIKESIFCYWSLLYDEKFNEYKESEFTGIIDKVRINETICEQYRHSVFLEIKENKWGILECGSTIHLVKLRHFLKNLKGYNHGEYKINSKEIQEINDKIFMLDKYLEEDNEDVLFLGIVKEQ